MNIVRPEWIKIEATSVTVGVVRHELITEPCAEMTSYPPVVDNPVDNPVTCTNPAELSNGVWHDR